MKYAIIGLIALALLAANFIRFKTDNPAPTKTSNKENHQKDNPYQRLRSMAFSVTPEQLGLELQDKGTTPFGIIMDLGINNNTATLVTYQSGDASLYLSSGGGVIGGVGHENVTQAVKQLIGGAKSSISNAAKTEDFLLPNDGFVNFYFLTNEGVFVGKEKISNIEKGSSKWANLFLEANIVITELRKSSEGKNE